MTLIWYQRKDGLWNAACSCGSTCCGIQFGERAECEIRHFENTTRDRNYNCTGRKRLPCGAKLPEIDPNHPEQFVFA